MAYTVTSAFNTFYDAINLGGDHRETANARRDRLVQLLSNHFTILDAFSTGSIPKFTALKARSDLDVMVVLHYGNHIQNRTPAAVLQSVRDSLAGYRTGARKNGQAVTLYYDTWPNVDVVPVARFVDGNGNVTHFTVPDANSGTWIESRPKEFAEAIEQRSSSCGANFRRIIKMVKAWNAVHSEYLTGYHIEVLALRCLDGNLDDTPWHMFRFFENARALVANSLWYDRSYADGYLSYADRQEALKRLDTAIATSREAWHATYGGNNDQQNGIRLWRQVFGSDFPAYG
jgi:hypothetical protein